jgi:hypothetical protein
VEKIDPALLKFANENQAAVVEAVNKHGGFRAAARALGREHTSLVKAVERLKGIASRNGYAPGHWEGGVAPGYLMGKVTVHRTPNGVVQQWERQHPDADRFEQIKEAIDDFIHDRVKLVAPAPAIPDRQADVVPWIIIGDAHFGMLAHEAETGENFDLKIAEREMCAAIEMLIEGIEPCDRLVIEDCGDFTHYENTSATTEASGHRLDHDGRNPKMIRVYSRTMRFIVDKALEKANVVDIIINQGNHSRVNDWWMAELLRTSYPSDRVNVLDNDNVFIAYRMGKTLVMCHHSDKCRPAQLAHVMATDFAEDWGEAEYRYIDIGHIHHNMVLKEHPGVTVESFNQLAAKDKWAHDGGYRSRQSIAVVFRSRTYGEIGRRTLPIRQVRDTIQAAMNRDGLAVYLPAKRRAFAA